MSFTLQHRQRGSFVAASFDVVGVVNCTGAALDPWLSTDPFVRQLLDEGIARAHPNGLGFDVDPDGRVLVGGGRDARQPVRAWPHHAGRVLGIHRGAGNSRARGGDCDDAGAGGCIAA